MLLVVAPNQEEGIASNPDSAAGEIVTGNREVVHNSSLVVSDSNVRAFHANVQGE